MNIIMRIVPTCKKVDQLHQEALRLRQLANNAFHDFYYHKAPTVENLEYVCRLNQQALDATDAWIAAFNARYDAINDWLNWKRW